MKKMFLAVIMLVGINIFAGQDSDPCQNIQLPDKETLKEILRENEDFGYFDAKTHLSETLGGQEKHPFVVAMAVELAFKDFEKYMKDGINSKLALERIQTTLDIMDMNKPYLIETILRDNPAAIKCLKESGLLGSGKLR